MAGQHLGAFSSRLVARGQLVAKCAGQARRLADQGRAEPYHRGNCRGCALFRELCCNVLFP